MTFDAGFIFETFPLVLQAVPVTLLMVIVAAPLGWLLGFLMAECRVNHIPVLGQLVTVFVSLMRSVPEVVLLYVMYYLMPVVLYNYFLSIGLEVNIAAVPSIVFAIVTFVLNQSAYASEVFRAAIASVDRVQLEAAYAVGMTKSQAMVRVILPQAIVSAIPNLNGLFVGLLQGTSLAYFVGVHEIMATSIVAANQSYAYLEAYVLTTIIYEVLSYIINRIFRVIERRAGQFRTGRSQPKALAKSASGTDGGAKRPAAATA
ncbi:MAG: amino acid ABC transporter permease [Coriobacteriia bacterium]|nr:amino acid ABC transporter permease [Coriobacteriia bacterium]MBS5477241.1 amino acid ABC transporter permease [Coriobacteriia bacterium]